MVAASGAVRIGTGPKDAIKAHYALSAGLQASVGVVVEARALYFFKGQLFKYTFKTWDLGNYLLERDIKAKADCLFAEGLDMLERALLAAIEP